MKYLVEIPEDSPALKYMGIYARWGTMYIEEDWYSHRDKITMDGKQEYMVWDPWHNRFLRRCFRGKLFYKKLRMYDRT